MTNQAAQVDIEFTFRNVDSGSAVKEYAVKRLGKVIDGLSGLKSASIEITREQARPPGQRLIVEVTLVANGTLLRVEENGPDSLTAIDRVRDPLDRRVRAWKGRAYSIRRRRATSHKQAIETEATRGATEPEPEDIVRFKTHVTKPMFPEDAVEQMGLLGHDFFYFLNAETSRHNVVYRRKAGGYGLIEPAID